MYFNIEISQVVAVGMGFYAWYSVATQVSFDVVLHADRKIGNLTVRRLDVQFP